MNHQNLIVNIQNRFPPTFQRLDLLAVDSWRSFPQRKRPDLSRLESLHIIALEV